MITTRYYAEIDQLGVVLQCLEIEGPEVGPPEAIYSEHICRLIDAPIRWSDQPTPTSTLEWDGTGAVWMERGEMTALISSAIEKTYADNDAVTRAAVGDRVNEYAVAATAARAFAASGYSGTAARSISSYAQDNGTNVAQSNEWAARAIIARADAFDWAQDEMRAQRFNFQRAMRNCTTPAELAHVTYLWDQFIAGLRAQLGL